MELIHAIDCCNNNNVSTCVRNFIKFDACDWTMFAFPNVKHLWTNSFTVQLNVIESFLQKECLPVSSGSGTFFHLRYLIPFRISILCSYQSKSIRLISPIGCCNWKRRQWFHDHGISQFSLVYYSYDVNIVIPVQSQDTLWLRQSKDGFQLDRKISLLHANPSDISPETPLKDSKTNLDLSMRMFNEKPQTNTRSYHPACRFVVNTSAVKHCLTSKPPANCYRLA